MMKEMRRFNRHIRRNVIYQFMINMRKRRKILSRRIVQ